MSNYNKDEYLFQDGVEYSTEEVAKVIAKMFHYLKTMRMRFDLAMITDPEGYSNMFQMTSEQIKKYVRYFEGQHYDGESARKIVKAMNAVYHILDITIDEALDFANYASEKRLTVTKGIEDKFSLDFNEINRFLEEVMEKNLVFCNEQAMKYGKEIFKDIEAMLPCKQN